jgi:hypothetical protein
MTKQEWLVTLDPLIVLQAIIDKKPNAKKLRLAAVACCRRIWDLLSDERSRHAVDLAEQYAENGNLTTDRTTAEEQASAVVDTSRLKGEDIRNDAAHAAALCLAYWASADWGTLQVFGVTSEIVGRPAQMEILDCVFGIPFHPITLSPSWLTSTVVSLANQMYDTRDFSAMPILADALMDASCDNETILTHCRGPGPHVRGCFVIDLLTGRE